MAWFHPSYSLVGVAMDGSARGGRSYVVGASISGGVLVDVAEEVSYSAEPDESARWLLVLQ